jgi:hypothetical protein
MGSRLSFFRIYIRTVAQVLSSVFVEIWFEWIRDSPGGVRFLFVLNRIEIIKCNVFFVLLSKPS